MLKALKEYSKKRDFKQTAEPAGKSKKATDKKQLAFVIQRHDATRLHYDFRLELNGTLKSWAVPKGPSLNPADKRLAVMVEDHPYDYKDFYGTIPAGNYGGGEVEIWDEGLYFPVNEQHQAITEAQAEKNLGKGELKVLLAGTHLKGEFVLVRLKGDDKNWLLIKHKDDYSTQDEYDIEGIASIKSKAKKKPAKVTKKAPAKPADDGDDSVIANKSQDKKAAVKKVAAKSKSTASVKRAVNKTSEKKAQLKKAIAGSTGSKTPVIKTIKPMLAYTASEAFDDEDWLFEYKWDGYRSIAIKTGDEVQLISRNEISFNAKYPAIVEAITASIDHDCVLDGEVVAMVDGKPSFQALQHAAEIKPELRYYVFDLLYLDGHSVMDLPLTDRKKLLEQLLQKANNKALQYSAHIPKNGKSFLNKTKKADLEGIMAKKADSLYTPNTRSREWLKIKNRNDREAIIVGYTEGTGSRSFFGALILAEKDGKGYRYIGHTGTGFNEATLKELYHKMQPLVTNKSPFDTKIKVNNPVTWITPKLVCTIYFSEVTNEGMLRHPVFAGLRPDKKAGEVEKEPAEIDPDEIENIPDNMEDIDELTGGRQELVIDGKTIPVTNLDKIYFPDKKITKGDVIAYYHSIAPYILPQLKDRPMSLKRNPNGIHGEAFFHKNAGDKAPSWVKTYESFSESSNRTIEYVLCNDLATLMYLANLGCIEMNPWNSTYKKTENPTWVVIDIDPSDGNTFEQVIETAQAVKEVADKAGIEAYCKTSGASGLHVYIPLGNKYDYDIAKNFAEMIAIATHEIVPDFTSLVRNLKKRGEKIYVDFLQNRGGQTLASAYSLRPVEAGSVSTPLEWKEVKKGLHPSQFTIFNIQERLHKTGDLFSKVLTGKNDIKKAMKLLHA
jgi:bifunctional non-homologous end joining protein LigD